MTALAAQVDQVVDLVPGVLGEDGIGAYLHRPTATGALRPHVDHVLAGIDQVRNHGAG